jgi:hypothetical protein
LKKDRVIEKAVFSVFLGLLNTTDIMKPTEVKSKVTFGGYDQKIVDASFKLSRKDQGISWFPVNSADHWQVGLRRVKFGGKELTSKVGINAIFDSGASQMGWPQHDYDNFREELRLAGKECEANPYGTFYCKCKAASDPGWPTVTLTFGETNYMLDLYLKGEDYLEYSSYWGECRLRMEVQRAFPDKWLLGAPFLHAYYAIHDMDKANNLRIGFVRINKDALVEVPRVRGAKPEEAGNM